MASWSAASSAYRQARADVRARPARTPLTVRAARTLARVLPSWPALRTLLLSLAGFGLLTYAAWEIHHIAGLAVGGVSLLVLEALSGGER